jgi:hypothetical protein
MGCPIYLKHHNIIDGIFMDRKPDFWDEISYLDHIDAEDDDGELYSLFKDIKIYDIEDISGFTNPIDTHNINETIFIIRRLGMYYLCETQGEKYIKFSVNISNVDFVKIYDRSVKLEKITYRILNT